MGDDTIRGELLWENLRLSRALSIAGKACYVACFTLLSMLLDLSIRQDGVALAIAAVLALASVLCLVASFAMSFATPAAPGELDVLGDAIVIRRGKASERRIPRAKVTSAYVVERDGGHAPTFPRWLVELDLEGGDRLTAFVASANDARELVARLGFGPGGKRTSVRLASVDQQRLLGFIIGFPIASLSVYLALSVVGGRMPTELLRGRAAFVVLLLGVLLYEAARRALGTRTIAAVVGDDAIAIREPFGVRRIPYADIAAIRPASEEQSGVVQKRDGSIVSFGWPLLARERVNAILALAEERRRAPSSAGRLPFDRGGRLLDAWRDHLRGLMTNASYRSASSSVDAANEVLRSPDAPPIERVGAALALRIAGEPERVRIAAAGAVDDDLRAAFEAVADDADDERLEASLRRLDGRT